jgi:hypothetical protein
VNTTIASEPGRPGESAAQAVIMLAVAGMAGAASFTHVHDWTMHNSPAGTGNWFGWANAMVSELIPLAAGLEARRRIRHHSTAGAYPIMLIVAAVALSLTGQFAEATHSISGWLISAVPALGFLALVKLVLSSPTAKTAHLRATDERQVATTMDTTATTGTHANTSTGRPTAIAPSVHIEPVPTHVLASARFAATNHRQTTGSAITAADLAARISVSPTIAADLLRTLAAEDDTPRRVNGHHVNVPAGGLR